MKTYQVVTDNGSNGGIDEKLAYRTLSEARKVCRQYIQDGYRGAGVYHLKRKKWIESFEFFSQMI